MRALDKRQLPSAKDLDGPIPTQYPHLRPWYPLRFCPGCALTARWRYDKRGRPFHFCAHCGIRIFIYNTGSLVAVEMLVHMIARFGPHRWRLEVQGRTNRRLQAIGVV